ncbi:transcriptional activator RfaH [Tamilnaduibacter salinus]|uniref:transcriptional activator RfaH n=1 Tax=Tamilnaduibacter salinus TaxID=1484056 RepID=UPI00268126B1|nr:transcriptional activator RfaH [Tamilnaduibacter salinus]
MANLQNQGASCFYPKIEVERIRGNKRQKRLEPLFPGYLFINIEQTDPLWAKLRSTRGVGRVVSFAGKPAPIDDAVIDHIRDSLDKVADAGGIQPGQPVLK